MSNQNHHLKLQFRRIFEDLIPWYFIGSLVSCVANIDSLMGAEIEQTLERTYDVVMSSPEIRQLSFGKLKALESGAGGAAPTATSIETIKYQLVAKHALAIEGFVTALKRLAAKLTVPVYGLQCTKDAH
ncbi:fatty acid synthase-like [Contarinia nasturtii]|uniref:fatty acid synthase-like n=1 Tax=Contarinia nasturtii TaxID=265458 RepID=UPI0012D3F818|nr:fatty acid synthase-like [Contarinia nasturtii]